MDTDLAIVMREISMTHAFWMSVLPVAAVALISWTFVIIITILKYVKDFRRSS